MKNYIGFVNDHSGSMAPLAKAAIVDYNNNITAVKDAATKEMLDTVVSVVGVGIGRVINNSGSYTRYSGDGYGTERQVVISNPHVLKPVTSWSTDGGTPLYDGIGDMIQLLSGLPDSDKDDVSFLIMITTDGEEAHSSIYTHATISTLIKEKQNTGRWTFVFRVPKGNTRTVSNLGVPLDNIQEWETTATGMAASTQVNTEAMSSYFRSRTAGAKSSNSFYAKAEAVNVSALVELDPKKVSLYVVDTAHNGAMIRDFILTKRMNYLKGAAFYQLTKTEAKVGPHKLIVIRDRDTGKMYSGKDARKMIGLPTDKNVRLHPGDHGNYDLFIQSESINRKLVAGTGVIYWPELGTEFTAEELERFNGPSTATVKPAVVTLPKVTPTNVPTKSPLVPTPRVTYYESRGEARGIAEALNAKRKPGEPKKSVKDLGKLDNNGRLNQKRWYVA